MQLYQWLSSVADDRGSAKALVYRDTYLSWRGLLHRVDRRAQELHAMGIGPGAWVGLMLGNVPDFVILTLAVSKVEGVVVPLDPTTGNRELEMILEAAPLRALVTRPRGGEGVQAAAGLPYYASAAGGAPAGRAAVEVRARDPPAPAGDAAVVQPVQARAAREPGRRGAATRPRSCSSPRRWAAIPRAWSRPPPTWARPRRRSARRWA